MDNLVVMGAQWGDEGKGKIVDLLAGDFDIVARFQGGNNAGHTVIIGEKKYALHLVPSGVLRGKEAVLGNGMVIDPFALRNELKNFDPQTRELLHISGHAHVVMHYHLLLDNVEEILAGKEKIGTTGKGMGPTYTSKMRRSGAVRMIDLLEREDLERILRKEIPRVLSELQLLVPREKLVEYIKEKHAQFEDPTHLLSIQKTVEAYHAIGLEFKDRIEDVGRYLNAAVRAGKRVLFEGAQGALLDVDHGTYPFVTSSNTTRGGIYTGTGYNGCGTEHVMGIVKAYATRVGGGPFPTELLDATGEKLRKVGHEFGTTTGRPRRCGWLDLVALGQAHDTTRYNTLTITKLDVLTGHETIKVCTGYTRDGEPVDYPQSTTLLGQVTPVYEEFAGWQEDITGARTFADLPPNCQAYLRRIEELMQVPIDIISVGPERGQTIIREAR